MKQKMREKIKKIDYWLVAILILAAFLYGWNIWKAGYANQFYTAAIVSMSKSWKAFWYGSFDPASFITVDKPPVALWFMVICVKIFGFHSWSIVLSSVLFGIGSVFLMYKLIKPYFGRLAANLGALFMTLTPIVVANSRTNNMDATLVFFLLLAGYVLHKSIQKHKPLLVLVSFALIGIAFNIKMLQAFMVLPTMYFFYFIASKQNWKKKSLWTIAATASLAVFTLAWPLAVDSTSKSSRPYIGSSTNNSVLNLAFGYNGTERLLGQSTGTGGAFPGMNSKNKGKAGNMPGGNKPSQSKNGNMKKPSGTKPSGSMKKPSGQIGQGGPGGNNQAPGKNQKIANSTKTKQPSNSMKKPSGKMGGQKPGKMGKGGPGGKGGGQGAGGGIFNVGKAGPFRIFQTALGQQVSWLLPLSLIGFVIAYFNEWRKKRKWFKFNKRQTHLLYWFGWLVPVYGFFSMAQFFHPYYMIMIAPPIAALAAIGIASFVENKTKKKKVEELAEHDSKEENLANDDVVEVEKEAKFASKVNTYLMAVVVLATAGLQAWYVYEYYSWATYLLIIAGLAVAAYIVLSANKKFNKKASLSAILVTLLLAPGFWSLTPTLSGESAAIPTSGPSLLSSNNVNGSFGSGSANTKMISYLEKHNGNATYLFATMDSNTAAPYIIKTGKAVMTIGGYNGTDNAISLKKFKQLVKAGKVKYFYLTNDNGNNNAIVKWVKKYGTKVSLSKYGGNSTSSHAMSGGPGNSNGTLYKLSVK